VHKTLFEMTDAQTREVTLDSLNLPGLPGVWVSCHDAPDFDFQYINLSTRSVAARCWFDSFDDDSTTVNMLCNNAEASFRITRSDPAVRLREVMEKIAVACAMKPSSSPTAA
jgi:hypothetical protein